MSFSVKLQMKLSKRKQTTHTMQTLRINQQIQVNITIPCNIPQITKDDSIHAFLDLIMHCSENEITHTRTHIHTVLPISFVIKTHRSKSEAGHTRILQKSLESNRHIQDAFEFTVTDTFTCFIGLPRLPQDLLIELFSLLCQYLSFNCQMCSFVVSVYLCIGSGGNVL